MLRMVCLDVDGTLLPKGDEALSPETVATLRRLTDKGITVVIASGRPYDQLKRLFEGLSHRLIFICLDGAVTFYRDCVLHKRPLLKQEALRFLNRYPTATVNGRDRIYRENFAAIGEPFLQIELPNGTFCETDYWYRVAYQDPTVTELVAPCADKGNALRTVMDKFGVAAEETAAFGDGENDLPMLKAVSHPYVMANASLAIAAPRTASVPETLRQLFNL